MSNQSTPRKILVAAAAASLAAMLVACDPAPPPDEASKQATPAPAPVPPAEDAPASAPAPSELPPPEESPADPALPAPDPPPPTDPSPAPKPTAANEPSLASMRSARPPAKLSVPVDLKYSFDGDPLGNQPVTLHLAAVPRVAGTNLGVSIKAVDGIQVASAGGIAVQKANANGAYRQHFSVTRQASAPAELRVLVTMDMPEGSGFGFYSIPLDAGTKSQKQQDSVKQR
jgi:hypothetical protein